MSDRRFLPAAAPPGPPALVESLSGGGGGVAVDKAQAAVREGPGLPSS